MATARELLDELGGYRRDAENAAHAIEETNNRMTFSAIGHGDVAKVSRFGGVELRECILNATEAPKLAVKLREWFPDPTPTPPPDPRPTE